MVKKVTTKKAKAKTSKKTSKATKPKVAAKKASSSKTKKESTAAASKKAASSKAKVTAKKASSSKTKKKSTVAASKKAASSKAAKKPTTSAAKKKTGAKARKTVMGARDKVIHAIKQDLLSQRGSLLKEAEETLSTLPTDLNFPDMGDQATAETDRNFILRLRDRERMLLKKIEETIERIDGSDYGICEECGNEIGTKRLEARPVTTYCIECKTRQEEEERIAEGG